MNDVRGVADQRQPLGDEFARREQAERKGAARSDHFQLAEMQAEALFQFGVKFRIRQRDDALGLARVFGPDDRAALAGQRQDRERARPGENAPRRGRCARAHAPTVVTIADWS